MGSERVGEWLRQPLSETGFPWYGLGMRSRHLGALLGKLYEGEFHAPWDQISISLPLRMVKVSDVFEIGPTHDLIGHPRGRDPRGAFTFDPIAGGDVALYPSLWSADADNQRRLVVSPTHDGDPVLGREKEQNNVLETRSDLFISRVFRMTFQSLPIAMTEEYVLGGRSWTALLGQESTSKQASALWLNGTLGLLALCGYGQITHRGRATLSVSAIADLPIPDFSADNPAGEHARSVANREFERLSQLELLPAAYAFNDANRREIDDVALMMLGIDSPSTRAAIDRVRRLWCREPLVHGGNRKIMKELGIEG